MLHKLLLCARTQETRLSIHGAFTTLSPFAAAGQAAAGEPWQHYDLGHGLCSYTFFEQCQHRMACARCDFYIPKHSSRAQLLEAKANLQRMLIAIPLTDDERAAVDDGQEALDKLLERLAWTLWRRRHQYQAQQAHKRWHIYADTPPRP